MKGEKMEIAQSIILHCPICDNRGLVIDHYGWLHCSGCCSLSPEAFAAFAEEEQPQPIENNFVEKALVKAVEIGRPYGFSIDDIRGEIRTHDISSVRQVLFHELHTEDGLSFNQIGRTFNKDPSSVRYAVKKVADALAEALKGSDGLKGKSH